MARRKKRAGKGTFSNVELPVAKSYLTPSSRNRLLLAGGAVVTVLLAWVAVDSWIGNPQSLSNGPLSSNHANLEDNCAACHTEDNEVSNAACSTCHEKHGDELGVFTFASHYLYRSNDFQRVVPSPDEEPCHACHIEHQGRDAAITQVPDSRCLSCHQFGSFNDDHPQFEFATSNLPDDDALAFTHTRHVNEVMERGGLEDVEQACLSCHHPRPEGKSFQPIAFDRHCDVCHLTTSMRTPPLPVRSAATGPAGVETLEAIQQRGGPATQWAYFLNPNEFRRLGDRVVKGPLYHRDPWVLENLRGLRRALYPEAGLADLLTTSPDVPLNELATLYREAIATLKGQVRGLRARPEPEVQEELARLGALLEELERRLDDPYAPLDEARFLLALGPASSSLSETEVEQIEALVTALTEPCQQCHRVDNATIARVRQDQRTLRRAEFNHRAHIVQRRCLDCHGEIPVSEFLGKSEPAQASLDRAAIHNLPRIESCQECHNPKLASNRCVTCHLFHPDQSRRSQLLLYIGDEPEG